MAELHKQQYIYQVGDAIDLENIEIQILEKIKNPYHFDWGYKAVKGLKKLQAIQQLEPSDYIALFDEIQIEEKNDRAN